ncbi:F-box/WD repeat-containing protein mec-15 isoform X2 [Solenopsis invicta]|uniref:F-box/WD repeat-containing protein mec-15 isoform X2 n=1 Tax=Solenopsis invicta TaxID=13686 RepID=UPI00193E1490|nr:F-box/WD repeat-containing protein mec-15 isoform X2 [Solenopsis invicta]
MQAACTTAKRIFLHICSFLKMGTSLYSLSLVCKRFYQILKDASFWRKEIIHRWPDARDSPFLYPKRPDELYMKFLYVAIEKETAVWERYYNSMDEMAIFGKNFTSDTMLRMPDGTTCIVAASHYSLIYWKLPSHEELLTRMSLAHKIRAYIWGLCDTTHEISANHDRIDFVHHTEILDLTAIDNTIYSCSWDQTVKSFMLTDTGFVQLTTYNTNEPNCAKCMSSGPMQSLFATGSERGSIFVFDSRLGPKPITKYRLKDGPVIKLAMDSEYILSLNQRMSVWDQRAGKIMKSITFPNEATCMSMQKDWVCVGDTYGEVHVLNPKNGFKLVKSYSIGSSNEIITGVHLTHGCLISCIKDVYGGTVKIGNLTNPSKMIRDIWPKFRPICRMNYLNGTFTISRNNIISVWRPK